MINNILKEIGLTDNETKVYIALLDLGESKSGEIIRKADIRTGKIYEIFESLKNKGLISEIKKDRVKIFSPASPERVLAYLDEKKDILNKQKEDFNSIMPEILSRINSKRSKSHIEIFTGFKGLKTAFAKEIKHYSKENTLYVTGVLSADKYYSNIPRKYGDHFYIYLYGKRNNSDVKIKKILSEEAREDVKEKNAEIRYIEYSSFVSINIINDLTILGIFTNEPIFITIENEEVAKSFIENFNVLWKIAKK